MGLFKNSSATRSGSSRDSVKALRKLVGRFRRLHRSELGAHQDDPAGLHHRGLPRGRPGPHRRCLGEGATGASAGLGGASAPVPAARRLSPGALGGRGRPMDGRLVVTFPNAPQGTRFTPEQKRSDEISLDVDAGFLMGGA